MAKEKEYISLKEAAKMSGYSSDYVGQLIRSGKLSGKQVFSSVVWMTTEEAMLQYLQKEKKSKNSVSTSYGLKDIIFTSEGLARLYSVVTWAVIGIFVLFIVLLVSVFSVSIDHSINQKYQQQASDTSNS